MKLLDANIFIYAAGKDHPLMAPCLRIVEGLEESRYDFTIDTEVPQEILHVYRSRREVSLGVARANKVLDLFPGMIVIRAEEIRFAGRLLAQYPRLEARDALHAAVVQLYDLEGIVSADRAFDSIPGFRRFDPVEMAEA
jgi:predicted nucleic acid-binding protein